jgi:hypothetical protein
MRKRTYAQKLSWLRTHNVITKKEKPIDSTVSRLYSFYHRHPLSTPRNLAYGYPRRIEAKIERHGEKATVRSPKGKVTARDYILRERKKIDARTQRALSNIPNLSVNLNRNLKWSKKGLDVFHFELQVKFTEHGYSDEVDAVKKYIHSNIMPKIAEILRIRRPLYDQGEHVIGVKVNFKTLDQGMQTYKSDYDEYGARVLTDEQITVHEFHMTVVYRETYRSMEELEDDIFEALEHGAGKVFDYKYIVIILDSIEVGIITRQSMNRVEQLRVG